MQVGRFKIKSVIMVLVVLAAVALATGADWTDTGWLSGGFGF